MTDAENHLVAAHAYLELVWSPIRHLYADGRGRGAALIWVARGRGFKLPALSRTQQAWKASERMRDDLAAKGLWDRGAPTPEGKRLVRSWTWIDGRADLTTAARRIVDCAGKGWCRQGGWVAETLVCGWPWGGDTGPLTYLQILLTPALIDGWIESQSTCAGHAFYRLRDADVDIEREAAESMPAELDYRKEAADAYGNHLISLRRLLLSGALGIDTGGELGEIPLAVGVGMLDESKSYHDVGELLFAEWAPRTEAASDGN
jgi:hypothetical protein